MLYSCTHMVTVGVKRLNVGVSSFGLDGTYRVRSVTGHGPLD